MPELISQLRSADAPSSGGVGSEPAFDRRSPRTLAPHDPRTERLLRDDLRRQIATLEQRLGELFASAFPRRGIEWKIGAVGGPRVLGAAELERVRDALVVRIREAQAEISRQAEIEERNRARLESMIAEPERYRWLRVSGEDVGERGCRHWHSRPRFGILGMLLGWWRVKLSSGCPLALGRDPVASRELQEQEEKARTPPSCRWFSSVCSAVC